MSLRKFLTKWNHYWQKSSRLKTLHWGKLEVTLRRCLELADRGTSNAPKTRNPERPHSHPSRLDQYGEALNQEFAEDFGVKSNKEAKNQQKRNQC